MKLRPAFALIALLVTSVFAPAQEKLDSRLQTLCDKFEAKRVEYHIPGMALAVVHHGEVVLIRGFGVADLETKRKVGPETLFAIGSTTKAFTSAAVGMMVDEGKMSWDDPVAKFLPNYDLPIKSKDENARVEMQDILSHRTGFPRMSVLFASGKAGREQILEAAGKAKPWKSFRRNFYYSNVQFMAAGQAVGAVAETTWDEFVQQRIFKPLGMEHSTTSLPGEAAQAISSKGYLWKKEDARHQLMPPRDLDNIGPAGSINSNVSDMSRWVRMLLNDGEFDGMQIISEASLRETWQPKIAIGGGIDYGMGWMLRTWQDRQVVEHGGNTEGYSAAVALLPEEELGFVLLCNISFSPLQTECLNMVWSGMLNEEKTENEAGAEPMDFQPYIGKYVADFGSWNGVIFTVQEKDGALAVDVPSQMLYELLPPDEEGRWYFAMTDTVSVSFEEGENGGFPLMRMHQNGMDFELPREGVTIKGEIPLGELEPYLGDYFFEREKQTWKVKIQNNRLALDVPSEMVYELAPPDADGNWAFRVKRSIQISFQLDESGVPESLTIFQGGHAEVLPRQEKEAGVEVQTLEDVYAKMNLEAKSLAFAAAGTLSMTITGLVEQSGVEMTGLEILSSDGYRYTSMDFGVFGKVRSAITPTEGWSDSDFEPFKTLSSEERFEAIEGSLLTLTDFRANYDHVRLEGEGVAKGIPYWKLRLHREGQPARVLYIEKETGDIRRAELFATIEGAGQMAIVISFKEYSEVNGLRIAHKTTIDNEAGGRVIFNVKKMEFGLPLDLSMFKH